ncbi:hypothetical protein [Kitasatospora sp. NPDC088351]|uniref:hypothetical protein n=1 Tax=unclassified Kitasatospora TaxID=2633591 RepID=UPI003443F7DB
MRITKRAPWPVYGVLVLFLGLLAADQHRLGEPVLPAVAIYLTVCLPPAPLTWWASHRGRD